MLTPSNIDPTLVISKALSLSHGTVASGANRYDADTIAKYEFQTGTGYGRLRHQRHRPFRRSDHHRQRDLGRRLGHHRRRAAARRRQPPRRARSSTPSSRRPASSRSRPGSRRRWSRPTIPTWSAIRAATRRATSRSARPIRTMISCCAAPSSDLNGMPQLQTPDAAMALQASLQHVVLTYDPVNGRQIYVNGVNTGTADPQKGGTISNWDSTFALVLGNEVSGDAPGRALIKFVAIHSRALTRGAGPAELQRRRGPALLHAVQRGERARRRHPGLHDVHGEPVRQLPAICSTSRRSSRSIRPRSRPAFPSRACASASTARSRRSARPISRSTPPSPRRITRRRASPVDHRHGHRLGERAVDRQVLPAVRPARHRAQRDRRADAGRAAGAGRSGDVGCRRAHLRAGQFDLLAAHRRSDHECGGERDLSGRAAAAAADTDAGGRSPRPTRSASRSSRSNTATRWSRPRPCRPRCSRA